MTIVVALLVIFLVIPAILGLVVFPILAIISELIEDFIYDIKQGKNQKNNT